jgi:hypothetical protein
VCRWEPDPAGDSERNHIASGCQAHQPNGISSLEAYLRSAATLYGCPGAYQLHPLILRNHLYNRTRNTLQ